MIRSLLHRLAVAAIALPLFFAAGCDQSNEPTPSTDGRNGAADTPADSDATPGDTTDDQPADNAGTAASEPAATLRDAELGETPNVHVHGNVFLCGQPTAADLVLAKAQGVSTIIDLRTEGEDRGYDEAQAATDAGINYVNIPFRGPETLSDEVFDQVRTQIRQAPGKVVMHCGGANRVGGVWLAHRVLDGGLSFDEALAEAREVGLKTEGFVDRAKAYIEKQKQQ